MEALNGAEKKLSENLSKCRCCFRMLINDRAAVQISQETRIQFYDLTQIELLESDLFSEKMCELCAQDLNVFTKIRADLISKQKDLYDLAGFEEPQYKQVPSNTYEEVDNPENPNDMDMSLEYIEQEDEIFDDQMNEDHLFEERIVDEDSESTDAAQPFLKIEKVEDATEAGHSFELFEEIVIVDSNQKVKNEYDSKEKDNSYWFVMEEVSCELCGIELAKSHLEEHKREMHKPYDCEECNKNFPSMILYKRHLQDEHKDTTSRVKRKKHFCPLCPKDYDYKKQLTDHIRSFHERERNAQCCVCLKSFYHRDLKKHMEHVHAEKVIDCDVCGKKYTCVENLKLHMKYHKPPEYVCSSQGCGKTFHQKILLEHHEIKHTNEKTIACDECKATFFTIRDQKRHIQRVHEQVVRKCCLCDTQFNRKDKYRVHLLKKHNELSSSELDNMLDEVRRMKWNNV